ncbi:MAG: ATP-binding protein [Desulfotomaculaceae bacterium]|nr:ATP-binding protein [Desulfotomaculaceae bacterium]MDD4766406.1 ATP-binding protein [Desulfotomaculaceae bacterium]
MLFRILRNIGWRPVASYFFLFVVFIGLAKLYYFNLISLWFFVIISFFCSLVLAWILYSSLINPLREVTSIAQSVAGENFEQYMPDYPQNEIGDLARSINCMAKRLKKITDRLNAEKGRLQAIVNSMSDGVIIIDSWGRVILLNSVVEGLFRITNEASKGRNIFRVIRDSNLEKMLHESLETGKSIKKRIQLSAPDRRVFLFHVIPTNTDGDASEVVAILKNVTEKKKYEEMRSEFVANVSHELRTPLTSIRGFAETLLDGGCEDLADARKFLLIINKEAERLSRLIDDLLRLSKIEEDRFVPNLEAYDIKDQIKLTSEIMHAKAEEKNLTIDLDTPGTLPLVHADPDMIRQVLLNLIDNAINYTQAGGVIRISAGIENGFMKVDVQDNGIGLPPENVARLFERFYRVDKARSRDLGGTGLGLSIVKHIIEVHKGRVQVESKVGKGSTFSFLLPLAENETGHQ